MLLALMTARVKTRTAFGKKIGGIGTVREKIAESRIAIVSRPGCSPLAAHRMDAAGEQAARDSIDNDQGCWSANGSGGDRPCTAVYGAAGVSQDTPLAHMYAGTSYVTP